MRAAYSALGVLLAIVVLTISAPAGGYSSAYAWPVKPFGETHPVRSNFGDPRTLFYGPPTPATLYEGTGVFSFHNGVDIAAPGGTPVYPVRSGTVTLSEECKVFVDSAGDLVFQYWHIVTSVTVGERVVAGTTILGYVRRGYDHVHFAEIRHRVPVNPLAPGHLTPYDDRTAPRVGPIELRVPGTVEELLPELVRGRVEIDAQAYDYPKPAAPGEWATMPTAPALVTWHVERAADGTRVSPEHTAFDVRRRLPSRQFWLVYARGTRQNMPTFRKHRYWRQEGVFLFHLGVLDTRPLKDGIYKLVVTANDIRGNEALARQTLLIYNHHLWPPESKQA